MKLPRDIAGTEVARRRRPHYGASIVLKVNDKRRRRPR